MVYPKISIITPSYNQGQYIEATILSIINQRYPNLEYLIIDGGSSDDTVKVIQQYEKHLAYWVSELDSGQSHAINKGLRIASGEIVTWINSDDLLVDGILFRIAELFGTYRNIGVLHGGTMLFDEGGDIREDFGYENPTIERYLSGMSFSQPSAFIRRKSLDITGLLTEKYHYGMDYDLFARLALITPFVRIRELISKYRLHSNSKSGLADCQFIEDWISVFIQVVRNIRADTIEEDMRKLGVFQKHLENESAVYDFEFDPGGLDTELMFFYFLSYVFKSDYRTGNLTRARSVGRYLVQRFNHFMSKDLELRKLTNRAEFLPDYLIKTLRFLRRRIA